MTKAAKALKMPIDHLDQPCALFALYDGHQGHLCAEFVAKGFHVKLLRRLSADTDATSWTDDRIKVVLKEILEELDAEFLAKFRTAVDGCTVVVTLVTGLRLFVAWVGDSRCLLCRRPSEEEMVTVPLTEDHRADVEAEAARVKEAGGVVVDIGFGISDIPILRVAHPGYDERLREIRRAKALGLGTIGKEPIALRVTRALGEREFKAATGRALLTPTPGVEKFALSRKDRCVALICDGITDVMSNEEALDELLAQTDVRAACGALVQEAYKRGSENNLTAICVRIEWEGVEERKYEPMAKRAAVAAESSAAASKRRRLESAAAISAQKVAAYERAVAAEEKAARNKAASNADKEAVDAAVAAEVAAKAAAEAKAAEKRKTAEVPAIVAAQPPAPAAAAAAPIEAATPPAATATPAGPPETHAVSTSATTAAAAAPAVPTTPAVAAAPAVQEEEEDEEEFFL